MMQSTEQLEQSKLQERISSLYSYVHKHQNKHLEKKLIQLAEKTMNKEYAVAFCGHFSAGKSTMINRLIGENILPSSPIPTSANLVKVKTGEAYAKVYFKQEKPRMYLPPYDYEHVKNYCKDGDQIEWVEISHSDSNLPKGMVILDTPGIDSTDDAHRIATESAIHLADLIFYVMDYNHVQSEVNFLFTKDLTMAGKEIYLVINQVDKHREEELSIDSFKQSVVDSFSSWGVKPKGIFYTSLKEPDHPQNQFETLQTFLYERIKDIDFHLKESLVVSLNQLANEHLLWLEEENVEQVSDALELLNQLPIDEQKELVEKEEQLKNQINTLESGKKNLEKMFQDETYKILKNAYLMPFQTRELAEDFLKATQEGFKVGFIFSKQKTEAEKENRLNTFYQDLMERVSSQLDWHVKSYFQQILKEYQIQDPKALERCQSYQTPITKEILIANVKQGAVLSGEYLITYTNDVVVEITRVARKLINEIGEHLFQAIELKQEDHLKRLKLEWDRTYPYFNANHVLESWESLITSEKITVESILSGGLVDLQYQQEIFTAKEEDVEIVKINNQKKDETVKTNPIVVEDQMIVSNQTPLMTNKDQLIFKLKQTASELRQVNGFQQTANELMEKAARIENQGFTVALFGAFSAGKSSFANALMGAEVLPVSPNPTTAAINKILPVTDQFPHGTVRVKLKTAEQLLIEVGRSLKVFDLQANDFPMALSNIEKIISQSTHFVGNEKIHFSFLNAFQQGFNNLSSSLGEIIQTDIRDFRDFVANETKSCFVEWIELYYDCEFTRKGITLVDTPGADSINARHTGVAFDYIKNSDAILFVTYYNHAFSKADREFLIQLGRVKDTFELDKMFFIINAVDLANDDEELQSVISYVKSQLMTYGIRHPHLFALSSLLALKEKLSAEKLNSSQMDHFEDAFYQFISEGLLQTSLSSAESELQRIIHEINVLIEASNEDENVKAKRKEQLLLEKASVNEFIGKQSVDYLESRTSQELHELLFYIKQRVFLRFNDFFKESFNPSVLKDDGRNLKKALHGALEEFLLSVGYDFAQELRATSLRMDAYLRKVLGEYHQTISGSLCEINKELTVSFRTHQQNQSLEFANAFDHLNRDLFQKALSSFKNPKAFFEKNEKKKMMDDLYELLQGPADEYLQIEGQKLSELYQQLLNQLYEQQLTSAKLEIEAFYDRFISSLENKGQAEELLLMLSRMKE
jgi:small GTP-binding protein